MGPAWEDQFHPEGLTTKLLGWELSTFLQHWREAAAPGTVPTFLPPSP